MRNLKNQINRKINIAKSSFVVRISYDDFFAFLSKIFFVSCGITWEKPILGPKILCGLKMTKSSFE